MFQKIYRTLICDSQRYRIVAPNLLAIIKLSLINPGFLAVVYIRFIIAAKDSVIAKFLRINALRRLGIDISPGLKIGNGLRIDHPVGIVIGSKVHIGENVTISQQVTIGEKYNDSRSDGQYPSLGNNISIGAGTIILGNVIVGNNSTLAAQSLILSDVPENSTIYGKHK